MEDSQMTTITVTRPAVARLSARRLAPLAGLAAGPLFLTTVGLLTWAELGYMHRLGWHYTTNNEVPWPSGLALGRYGWIQIANFAATGLLLLAFVLGGLRRHLHRITGKVALALLTLLGAALTTSAFPTDHAAAAGKNPNTWHGWIHTGSFVAVALPAVIAPVFVGLALRRDPRWRPLAALSALVPPLLVGAFLVQKTLHDIAFTGFLVVVFGWLALLAVRLRRLDSTLR
jgi:Protein of unknown function (DUF998)